MMGCGKTTVARELAKQLVGFKYIDIDEEIEKSTQKKISEIFSCHGEQFFRALETDKIKQICQADDLIISMGGGAFEREENRRALLENGIVFYLKASADEIFNRIKTETHRPLLKENFSTEKISEILEKREKNYNCAHKIIDTNAKLPQNIAQEIIGVINDRSKN